MTNINNVNQITLLTSIAPGNLATQKNAIKSWLDLGFKVISINCKEEIQQLQTIYKDVAFHLVTRDARSEIGKPLVYLDDIFSYFHNEGTKICGIINSDIYLKADINFCNFIAQEAADSLVIGSRVEVKSLTFLEEKLDINSSQIQYIWGFDYFFFDISILESYPKQEGFCMGMPWWDYWMAVVILRKNINLKKITSNLAYHVIHENNYSEKHWVKFGLKLLKYWQATSYLLNSSTDEIHEDPNSDNYRQLLQSCRDMANYIILELLPKKEKKITYCNNNSSSINTIKELSSLSSNFNFGSSLQESEFKVSAIVSTYNSEKFMRSRLNNLVKQTLYKKNLLEIIVINSGSQQNEEKIINEFQLNHPNIKYIKTKRETIYQAWNRGFKVAKGQYVINANTDDLFTLDGLECMANELDVNNYISAVYGDWLLTKIENDSFESKTEKCLFKYPEFFAPLFFYSQISSHAALLRKEVFNQIGYYNENFKVFGDREFMFRFCTNGLIAQHLPLVFGLYYINPQSLSLSVTDDVFGTEFEPTRTQYMSPENLVRLFGYNSDISGSQLAELYAVVGSYGKDFYWWWGEPISDLYFASRLFTKALELDPSNSLALNNQAIICCLYGQHESAIEIFKKILSTRILNKEVLQNNILAAQRLSTNVEDYTWLKSPSYNYSPFGTYINVDVIDSKNLSIDPLVSVIVPTKDRPEMLLIAVQSLLAQTLKNIEIIVVNDGGIDVHNVLNKCNNSGNIVYLNYEQNQERSAARNAGIRAAQGKYICYLDDDDNYYPNHIETLVKFLENSEYKIAYTDAVMAQQEKQNGQYITVHLSQPYSSDFDNDKILVNNFIPILCVMHEKSCLDQIGLFDETLTTHEDWDVWIRLSRHFQFAHIPQATCEFTRREDGTTTTSKNRADFIRTREIIYDKYWQYAENNPEILAAQQSVFKSEAKELATSLAQTQEKLAQAQLEQEKLTTHVEMNQEKIRQIENQSQQIQEEKQWLEAQLSSWKQTALQLQIELQQTENHRETSKI